MPSEFNQVNQRVSGNLDTVVPDPINYGNYSETIQAKINSYSLAFQDKNRVYNFSLDREEPAYIFLGPNLSEDSDIVGNKNLPEIYNKFILTSIAESRGEKFQIFETFGDSNVFFFDEKTKIYSFSGYLLDGDHSYRNQDRESWAIAFKQFWDKKFRGTRLVQNNQIAIITWKKNIIWGYPVNLSLGTQSSSPFISSFSFNFIVKKHKFNNLGFSQSTVLSLMSAEDRQQFETELQKLNALEKKIRSLQEDFGDETNNKKREEILEEITLNQAKSKDIYLNLLRRLQSTLAING
jgi:peroxiredoxin family protein